MKIFCEKLLLKSKKAEKDFIKISYEMFLNRECDETFCVIDFSCEFLKDD